VNSYFWSRWWRFSAVPRAEPPPDSDAPDFDACRSVVVPPPSLGTRTCFALR
jgi:hypothetical protein